MGGWRLERGITQLLCIQYMLFVFFWWFSCHIFGIFLFSPSFISSFFPSSHPCLFIDLLAYSLFTDKGYRVPNNLYIWWNFPFNPSGTKTEGFGVSGGLEGFEVGYSGALLFFFAVSLLFIYFKFWYLILKPFFSMTRSTLWPNPHYSRCTVLHLTSADYKSLCPHSCMSPRLNQLSIPPKPNHLFAQPQTINVQQVLIEVLPLMLVLHIKRFCYNKESGRVVKVGKRVV